MLSKKLVINFYLKRNKHKTSPTIPFYPIYQKLRKKHGYIDTQHGKSAIQRQSALPHHEL